MKPEIISTEEVYQGNVFKVLRAELKDGDLEYRRDIITHNGSAVIVPVFDNHEIALVRQYRHPAGKYLIELPAGTIDRGESPEEAALREVEEEIGYKAAALEKLTEFYVSPGFLTEKMHVFLATGLTKSRQNLDDDEILSIENLTFEEAYEKILSGEIEDAKTINGLLLAGKRFGIGF
ncbi:MAG: NUDIX hydrolase [Pyrinomonadaceae bacterium]|nr:NUDIX hydrolase [Pyrinomonadaceae bacterium]